MLEQELLSLGEARELLMPIDIETIHKATTTTVHIDCKASYPKAPFSPESTGTGVHIGNGRIITARHIFDRFANDLVITVSDVTGNHQAGQIIHLAENLDIGVMQLESFDLAAVEIETAKLQQYQTLFLVGFRNPLSPKFFRVMYLGDASDLYPNTNSLKDSFIIYDSIDTPDATARNGFSGCGVFNIEGKLVGMMFGKSRQEPKAIAIKGKAIQKMMQFMTNS